MYMYMYMYIYIYIYICIYIYCLVIRISENNILTHFNKGLLKNNPISDNSLEAHSVLHLSSHVTYRVHGVPLAWRVRALLFTDKS